MKTKFHTPRSNYEGKEIKNVILIPQLPVIFLAGPIRNAPEWQNEAIQYLFKKDESVFVVSPRRELASDLVNLAEKVTPTDTTFKRKRAWEQYYLNSASEKGCIIFWLPKEGEKESAEKVYAHITMMELGEWIARHKMNNKINLVIGTDGEFPEWSTIKFEIESEIPEILICDSLEQTINTALNLIK